MNELRFFPPPEPLDLASLSALAELEATGGDPSALAITGVAPIDRAGPSDLTVLDDGADPSALADSRAGACLLSPDRARAAPPGLVALATPEPSKAFALVAAALFPSAARPRGLFGPGVAPGAVVHPDARLEPDVTVDPGAVVGPRAEIGRGAVICANAVVGADVRIGRDSAVGIGASVTNALVGDRVLIGEGARIGQGGMTRAGEAPRVGRVIVQDGAEIGANAAVDRGGTGDTVVGERAKIDNLVQIGHDVCVGRCAVVFALTRIAPGAVLADHAVLGAGPAHGAATGTIHLPERGPKDSDGAS